MPDKCPDCGKRKQHRGRLLCNACYQRSWRRNNPDADRATQRRSRARRRDANKARSRAYYQANRERLISLQSKRDADRKNEKLAYNREYAKSHQAERREYMRRYRLSKRYSITTLEYRDLFEKQNHRCAICRKKETCRSRSGDTAPLAVDHDHDTGEIRGLLCRRCNAALGWFDKGAWTLEAFRYLGRVIE